MGDSLGAPFGSLAAGRGGSASGRFGARFTRPRTAAASCRSDKTSKSSASERGARFAEHGALVLGGRRRRGVGRRPLRGTRHGACAGARRRGGRAGGGARPTFVRRAQGASSSSASAGRPIAGLRAAIEGGAVDCFAVPAASVHRPGRTRQPPQLADGGGRSSTSARRYSSWSIERLGNMISHVDPLVQRAPPGPGSDGT